MGQVLAPETALWWSENTRMNPKTTIDFKGLGALVKGYRTSQKLTLRGAEEKCGVSSSTLSRLERGEARPDLDTVQLLVDWIGVPLERVVQRGGEPVARLSKKRLDPISTVEVQFRADPNLRPEAAEALIRIVKQAYEAMIKKPAGG
jgi:transcriptional regulator with XRE-family HTH domain